MLSLIESGSLPCSEAAVRITSQRATSSFTGLVKNVQLVCELTRKHRCPPRALSADDYRELSGRPGKHFDVGEPVAGAVEPPGGSSEGCVKESEGLF